MFSLASMLTCVLTLMELLANTRVHHLVLMNVAEVENVKRTYTCEDKQPVETIKCGCFKVRNKRLPGFGVVIAEDCGYAKNMRAANFRMLTSAHLHGGQIRPQHLNGCDKHIFQDSAWVLVLCTLSVGVLWREIRLGWDTDTQTSGNWETK